MRILKKNIQYLCSIFLLLSLPVSASDLGYTYQDAHDDQMLYLHAMVNYRYDASWQFDWEKYQFSKNGFRISVGSVTTTDLLTDWSLFINQDLGAGWRFQGVGTWNETRHKSIFEKSAFMGLEKNIYEGIHLHLLVNPSYFKENTDLNTGFTLYNDSRESYLHLALQYEDFVYDSKNDFAGESIQAPLSMTWSARTGRSNVWLYTEGRVSTGFKREFPDMEKSPDLRTHDQARNELKLKFYYTDDGFSLSQIGMHVYHFREQKSFSEHEYNYVYENIFFDYFAEHISILSGKHRVRAVGHMIIQNAFGEGYRAHEFERNDLLGGLFYEYLISGHSIELGYMFASFDFDYEDYGLFRDYQTSGFTDKVMLGWSFSFPNNAEINISLSHQVSIGGFGGANLQYIMFF